MRRASFKRSSAIRQRHAARDMILSPLLFYDLAVIKRPFRSTVSVLIKGKGFPATRRLCLFFLPDSNLILVALLLCDVDRAVVIRGIILFRRERSKVAAHAVMNHLCKIRCDARFVHLRGCGGNHVGCGCVCGAEIEHQRFRVIGSCRSS